MSNTLGQAAALIEKVGWIRGQYSSEHGYCAVGAITWAARDHVDKEQAQSKLATVIKERFGTEFLDSKQYPLDDWAVIVTWNDDPFRTRDDVVNLLKELAS